MEIAYRGPPFQTTHPSINSPFTPRPNTPLDTIQNSFLLILTFFHNPTLIRPLGISSKLTMYLKLKLCCNHLPPNTLLFPHEPSYPLFLKSQIKLNQRSHSHTTILRQKFHHAPSHKMISPFILWIFSLKSALNRLQSFSMLTRMIAKDMKYTRILTIELWFRRIFIYSQEHVLFYFMLFGIQSDGLSMRSWRIVDMGSKLNILRCLLLFS